MGEAPIVTRSEFRELLDAGKTGQVVQAYNSLYTMCLKLEHALHDTIKERDSIAATLFQLTGGK